VGILAHLPVCSSQRDSREQPAVARRLVRREADVLVGANDCVSSKVPPAALHVRVEIGLNVSLGLFILHGCLSVSDLQARGCVCVAVALLASLSITLLKTTIPK
jgi:hypothetical protein